MSQFQSEIFFIVRPVSVIRTSSVTGTLRGRYHTISVYDILLGIILRTAIPFSRAQNNTF